MYKINLTVLCTVFLTLVGVKPTSLAAQTSNLLVEMDSQLAILGDTMLKSRNVNLRNNAADSIKILLQTFCETPDSYQYKFKMSRFISTLYPKDSSFRIMTSQHFVSDEEYRYIGLIQHKSGKFDLLNDQSYEIYEEDLAQEELNKDNWLGSLYYNILESGRGNDKYYLLIGFNGYSFFNRMKTMEVLSFDDQNSPVFGKDIFVADTSEIERNDFRKIYLYSADVGMKLNFDPELGIIVLDHLIPVREIYPGQGQTAVPDGSYEGYKYKNGRWHQISVLEQKALESINIKPVLQNQKQTDLFGNQN